MPIFFFTTTEFKTINLFSSEANQAANRAQTDTVCAIAKGLFADKPQRHRPKGFSLLNHIHFPVHLQFQNLPF
jgi:hypothetical protein